MMPAERVEELLVERATQGLDAAEHAELEGHLRRHPEWDEDGYDLAAAAIDLALSGDERALQPAMRDRLRELGRQYGAPAAAPMAVPAPTGRAGRRARRTGYGWWAAAAALALAVVGWWPRWTAPEQPVPEPGGVTAGLLDEPGAEARRIAWTATEDTAARGAGGAVVWSGPRQAGYMEIQGLAANDPAVAQYQLWIFDRTRDERYPVDGGVFDVPAGSDRVVVPIDAKVEVREPYLFAVTVEPPGGVVVSSRERIVLVAEA